MRKLNWDYIHHSIKTKTGYSLSKYSQVKLGRSESYLSQCKNGGFKISNNALTYMIKDLGLDQDALWQIDETAPVDEPAKGEMTAEEFDKAYTRREVESVEDLFLPEPEEELSDKAAHGLAATFKNVVVEPSPKTELLEEISTKLDMVLELESKINTLVDAVNKLTEEASRPKESALDWIIKVANMLKEVS